MTNLPQTTNFQADADANGMRIDRFLAERAEDLSRSRIQSLIEDGQVRLGGRVVTEAKRRVKPGDEIELMVPAAEAMRLEPEAIPIDVRYEDDDLLVVHKSAGMVVHPAPGHDRGTLVHALLAHCQGSLSGIGGVMRPGIVHRIDKDVSGLLVIAKHDRAHQGLAGQFSVHSIDRHYDAIVYGTPNVPKGRIEKPIGRHPRDRKRQAIVSHGKPAITDYQLMRAGALAHLNCTLHTGRTHQIRVHLASLGHGLAGDPLYAARRRKGLPEALVAAITALGRIALHARHIGFEHPVTGEHLAFDAEMPAELKGLLTLIDG